MTLNITVATRRCIYQSADYRLLDLRTKRTFDFGTQKCVLVSAFRWSATVCFAGVGRTRDLDVSEWLAACVASIQPNDPFERLLEELSKAEDWLSHVPPPYNRHSFSIGAFVGSEPVFVLISNFEQPAGLVAETASPHLRLFRLRPKRPKTYVSGQKQAVTRSELMRLTSLAARDMEAGCIYSALAEVNRAAAMRSALVSPACFTTHVRLTGEGGGQVHDVGDRPFVPSFAVPEAGHEALTQLLDRQLGPGRAQLRGIAIARSAPTDDYHETQLREKPSDPNTHSNYGAYLHDVKGNLEAAEREYRSAIGLDGNHVNALGNLANLLWHKGDRHQADSLYRRALEVSPGNENVTWNYARFLDEDPNTRLRAREVVDQGVTLNPDSGRLLMLRAEFDLLDGNSSRALELFRQARHKGAAQERVEFGYACALQMSGAPIGDCIAAYHVAISLNPESGTPKLNLAQLLFVEGDTMRANRLLQEALRQGLDESSELEAQFYLLCHTSCEVEAIFRRIKVLLTQGARLRWNVRPNLDFLAKHNPERAAVLVLVAEVMAGKQDQDLLDAILAAWPQMPACPSGQSVRTRSPSQEA